MPTVSGLDGLRALAVLAVVAFHASNRFLPGGFAGVDVFFVISGYLITRLLLREFAESGAISFSGFYARRARRLLPALLVMVAVVLCVAWQVAAEIDRRQLATSAIGTTLFGQNLLLYRWASDYFQAGGPADWFTHAWSLSVEEQFYFVWPAIVLLACRLSHGRRWLVPGTMGVFRSDLPGYSGRTRPGSSTVPPRGCGSWRSAAS